MKRLSAAGLAAGLAVVVGAAAAEAQYFDVPAFQAGSPTFSANLQEIDVAPHDDGGFVVTWMEFNGPPDTHNNIVTHRFSRHGVEVAPPFRIDATGYGLYPAIVSDHAGGFVGAWMWSKQNVARALYARRLDGSAVPVSGEARIDTPNTGPMIADKVAYRSDGPVYAWKQNGIWLRAYDRYGNALTSAVKVADNSPGFEIDVDVLPGGGVVVVWTNRWLTDGSWARLYHADLTPASDAFAVDTVGLVDEVAASASGEFAVVGHANFDATSGGGEGPRSETWLRRYAADGTPLGDRRVVRSLSADYLNQADAAYDSRGNLLVVWREYNQTSGMVDPARARVYGAGGEPVGGDFAISDSAADEVQTAALRDDCFAIAWYHNSKAWSDVLCLCGGQTDTCGDGNVDKSCEACDDGNTVDGDGCDSNCTVSECGNGKKSGAEECDDGNRKSGDGCDENCTKTACGNGIVTFGEQCDDGNLENDDGCDSDCRPSGCGNGNKGAAEECDDGNLVSGDGCDGDCTASRCGNGIAAGNEACDDGNTTDGDGCDSNCTVSACGNGVKVGEEECDDGNVIDGDGCDSHCLVEQCGDGRREGREECDDGESSGDGSCGGDCTLRAVHDSVVLPIKPVQLSIPAGDEPLTADIVVQVMNADVKPVRETPGHLIRLAASDGDCPSATITAQPDFDDATPGVQDTALVAGGAMATAVARVTVSRGEFEPHDRHEPQRCTLWFTAGEASGTSIDPTPDNNVAAVTLDVGDSEDQDHSGDGEDEFYVESMAPVTMRLIPGQTVVTRQIKPVVHRSADLPAAVSDVEVTVSVSDGDCPAGTVGFVDFDRRAAGHQSRLMLARGRRAKGSLGLIVRADAFASTSDASPRSCTALVTATGAGDTDPSNNTTRLVVRVVDRNDF